MSVQISDLPRTIACPFIGLDVALRLQWRAGVRVPVLSITLVSLSLCACLAGASPGQGLREGMTMRRPRACASAFEDRAPLLLAMRGLPRVSMHFPAGEAAQQELLYPSSLCPDRALAMALESVSSWRADESLTEIVQELGRADCSARCYLNRESTLLGMVAGKDSRLGHRLLPEPPGDEALSTHWIFFVSVADLSQHGYWALVARDGSSTRWIAEN